MTRSVEDCYFVTFPARQSAGSNGGWSARERTNIPAVDLRCRRHSSRLPLVVSGKRSRSDKIISAGIRQRPNEQYQFWLTPAAWSEVHNRVNIKVEQVPGSCRGFQLSMTRTNILAPDSGGTLANRRNQDFFAEPCYLEDLRVSHTCDYNCFRSSSLLRGFDCFLLLMLLQLPPALIAQSIRKFPWCTEQTSHHSRC